MEFFGLVLYWIAGIISLIFIVGAIAIGFAAGYLEQIDARVQSELKDSWFWNGEEN
ncbi:hypothetical protein AWB67_05785 [Caballeronia terrestris]|jgi:hypothetical protein|uniref:Uncharacterized protein n=1 Tax=Caballeronia terrestris TaxID=1226301 RepID=A0A158KJ95_9BURK|nr:hypothetical protein [Caballeronia terrestris]SAL81218.1 hypothetical protein AWB67_05785 [Caballeronia terrestris]